MGTCVSPWVAAVQAAKNMGAMVRAFDVRAAAREQVESMVGRRRSTP